MRTQIKSPGESIESVWLYQLPPPAEKKPYLAGFFPPAPQAIAKRAVELAVPWFALTLGASGVGGVLLGLYGVNQPCATQELGVAVLEYLKEEDVDRDVFVVEVADNSFGGRIEFGRAENDLVGSG